MFLLFLHFRSNKHNDVAQYTNEIDGKNILNFLYIDNISLIDQFCKEILPRIHYNVKCFHLEPAFMERILHTTVYPNLIQLKIFNFEQKITLKYFTGSYLTCSTPFKKRMF